MYDCMQCPAYCCCAYPVVPVSEADVARIAKHLGVSKKEAYKRFTRFDQRGNEQVLQTSPDTLFDSACIFLNQEKRMCSIYRARPAICRQYPGTDDCPYFNLLADERGRQHADVQVLVKLVVK